MKDFRLNLYRNLHHWLERKIRARFSTLQDHDRSCPNCKRWGALMPRYWDSRVFKDSYELMICPECEYESKWYYEFEMLPTTKEVENTLQG